MILKKIFPDLFKNDNPEKDANTIKKHLKRFFITFMLPYKWRILTAILFMAFFSAANAGLAYLIKPIVNNVFAVKEMTAVYQVSLLLILVTVVKTFSQYIYMIILGGVAVSVIADARNKLYASFLKQDLSFYHKNSPGTLVSVMMNDINAINTLATEIPINLGRDLLTFIGLVIVMLIQEPLYASTIFLSVFFIVIPIVLASRKLKKYFSKTNTGFGTLTTHLEQSFNGIKEVKSYGMEKKEIENTKSIVSILTDIQLKTRRVTAIIPSFMELLGGVTVAGVLVFGSYRVLNGVGDSGSFFSFIGALLIAYQPLKRLTEITVKIQFGILGIKRYHEFIDVEPNIKDKPNAIKLECTDAEIKFSNVSFHYNSGHNVLSNLNFTIEKGKQFALVGRSGGGKTTIMNLIPRFYDVTEGQILINNIDVKDTTLKSLREHISFVSQDVVIFDTTVYENILYGREGATKEEVIEAAKNAFCLDFIEKMPDKFDTKVGARGMALSGGQRQRISIARALLKDAPILLLDEATSALDLESEQAIQKALKVLMAGKTTLAIAHRLSTIMNSDVILVVDNGKIVEQGNHAQLLEHGGLYKYLYNLQFKD